MLPDLKTPLLWALGLALVAALATAGIERTRGASARTDAASARQELAEYRAAQAESQRLAERAQRTEEQRRAAAVAKEVIDAQSRIASLEADLQRARTAAVSLHDAAVIAARRARAQSAAAGAGEGEPGADALDLLVGVLERHSDELVTVGQYADRLRIAGIACERSYDALTTK
ncbi:DUF2514 family protein [Variovorax sp. H27-G14]|uniref:DUF2514 family protein n=1 Tax=Variovorax sp. H27-G14 TaxID=3111914 RepID=UPI0038FCBAE2